MTGIDFLYWGTPLEYENAEYNHSRENERSVEVAVARHFLDGRESHGLEVGNVLAHYGISGHRVVDLHEQADGVENIDLFDADGTYDWIVCLSTLEHAKWDEHPRDVNGAQWALLHLLSLLRPGGAMLVSFPTGWHPGLDAAMLRGKLGETRGATFTRQTDPNEWAQDPWPIHSLYGGRTKWAETVWIGEFERAG